MKTKIGFSLGLAAIMAAGLARVVQNAQIQGDGVDRAVGKGVMTIFLTFPLLFGAIAGGGVGALLIAYALTVGKEHKISSLVLGLLGLGLCVWSVYLGIDLFQDMSR